MFWPPPHASWRTRPPSFVFLYAMRYAVSCSVPKHSPRARVTMCHLDPGRFQTPALENQQRCEQPRPSPQAVSPRCRPEAALPQPKGLTVALLRHHAWRSGIVMLVHAVATNLCGTRQAGAMQQQPANRALLAGTSCCGTRPAAPAWTVDRFPSKQRREPRRAYNLPTPRCV